jgi:hypothetical protein
MIEDLRNLGAVNTKPPLQISPRLKSKLNNVIFMWCESLAARPELFVNCDEHGNEDPAAWMNKMPEDYNSAPPVEPQPIPLKKDLAKPLEGLIVGYGGDLD